MVTLAIEFKDSASQIAALTALHTQRAWQPITLGQNGLFHMAFGAILGVGIWSKGRIQGTQVLTDLSSQMQGMATSMATSANQMQNPPTTTNVSTSFTVDAPAQPDPAPIAPLAPAPDKVSIPKVRIKA